MIWRPLLFSLFLSTLSVLVVVYAPSIPDERQTIGPSPYSEEIQRLASQGEKVISAEEYTYLSELMEKNTRWYNEAMEESEDDFLRRSAVVWKKKSSMLAPVIATLWGVLFFFFLRRWPSRDSLLVIVFPVFFAVSELMSAFECVLIVGVVVALWAWLSIGVPRRLRSETGN